MSLEDAPTRLDENNSLVLIDPLTAREIEILTLVAEGQTNPQIAEKLVIAVQTVRSHMGNVLAKLGAHNRTEAVMQARRLGVLSNDHGLSPVATAIAALAVAYPDAYSEFVESGIVDLDATPVTPKEEGADDLFKDRG